MTEYDQTSRTSLSSYIRFWSSPPQLPPSIRPLEQIAQNWNIAWRPNGRELDLVDKNKALSDLHKFENIDLASDNEDEQHKDKIAEAETWFITEIKHRIYKALYIGNFYDDLMPIETRYYTNVSERTVKILISFLIGILLFSTIFFLPSIAYNHFSTNGAILHSGHEPLTNFIINNNLDKTFTVAVSNNKISDNTVNPAFQYHGSEDISSILRNFRIRVGSYVEDNRAILAILSTSMIWNSATDEVLSNSMSESLVLRSISDSEIAKDYIAGRMGVLVTIDRDLVFGYGLNISYIVGTILLINGFISFKSSFFAPFRFMNTSEKIMSLSLLEEIVSSRFFFRKNYHYILALLISFTILIFEYVFTDLVSRNYAVPYSLLLDISAYDYRINDSYLPILVSMWALKFILLYTFVLVCLEMSVLQISLKVWQKELVGPDRTISDDDFGNTFSEVKKDQKQRTWPIMFVVVLPQIAAAGSRILEVWRYDTTGVAVGQNKNVLEWIGSLQWRWQGFSIAYVAVSAAVLVGLLTASVWPCFEEPEGARKYVPLAWLWGTISAIISGLFWPFRKGSSLLKWLLKKAGS